uniref:Small integral membrane protein 13 n=1 Tax=Oncorhynchus kisutch TaxID=8019 RepID=A0A8C7H369_ONCKI
IWHPHSWTFLTFVLFGSSGWYVVWQLFLSKFKFLREMLGDTGSPQTETQPSESKSKHTSPPTQRQRLKTARQRVVPPENTT